MPIVTQASYSWRSVWVSQFSHFECLHNKLLLNQDLNPISLATPVEQTEMYLQQPVYFLIISPVDFCGQWQVLLVWKQKSSGQPTSEISACYKAIFTDR